MYLRKEDSFPRQSLCFRGFTPTAEGMMYIDFYMYTGINCTRSADLPEEAKAP
jgi:hypothetical protein